jgi:hypothetical protein
VKSGKHSGRLGTRLRGKLADAYDQRGHQNAPLLYAYSPKMDRDLVLCGQLRYDHFVLTEADPLIEAVDHSPDLRHLGPDSNFDVHAIVTFQDGRTEWRVVVEEKPDDDDPILIPLRDAASYSKAQLHVVDAAELSRRQQCLANWKRAISWLTAARGTALSPYMTAISAHIYSDKKATLGGIASLGTDAEFPLYTAAVLKLIQQGILTSDLDDHALSKVTVVYLAE